MPSTRVQDEWISRVLGVVMAGGSASGPNDAAARSSVVRAAASVPIRVPIGAARRPVQFLSVQGRQRWQEAREAVAEQFGPLQDNLLRSDDAALREIATQVYPTLMQRLGPSMLTALMEVDAAGPEQRDAARAKAAAAIAAQRSILASDPLIRLIEGNPRGISIPIRQILGDALEEIERALNP